jgi:mannose-6-phosphate isomerase-like protein (cupin superfamily)
MILKSFDNLPEFVAGDKSILREYLNPNKEDLELRYSLAHATVKPNQSTQPHKLKTSEVYYILTGSAEMTINGEKKIVKPHQAIYIPPDATQSICNIGKDGLTFLCIVDPAWRPEDENIL